MLIDTKYKTNIQVSLSLFFDDDSVKKGTLEVGDIVELTYRRDHKKRKDTGKISNIYIFANGLPSNRETVVLDLDFSDEYESRKVRVPIQDIIDFNIIKYSDGSKPNKPPHKPPKPPCKPPHHPHPPYIPDWPIPPCRPSDDENDDGNTGDNESTDDELGHHYTHHTHSCTCRPCPPPRPIKMRSFYVGKNARVGRSKVL